MLYASFAWSPLPALPRDQIVFTADHIERLGSEFEQRWGRPPQHQELVAQVTLAVDDKVLELEARRLGLDEGDLAIRQRLISKMRAVSSDPSKDDEALHQEALQLGFDRDVIVGRLLRQKMRLLLQREPGHQPPGDETLAAWLEKNAQSFTQPPTVDFWQIFINPNLHGKATSTRVESITAKIETESLSVEAASSLSDPFPLPKHWRGRTYEDIAQRFGGDFAAQVLALENDVWSPPLQSTYGLHLVRVDARHQAEAPQLSAIRDQVAHAYEEERAAKHFVHSLEQLKKNYRIHIEWPDAGDGSSL